MTAWLAYLRKLLVTVAGLAATVAAANVLTGQAQTIATGASAVLTAVAVYLVPNGPSPSRPPLSIKVEGEALLEWLQRPGVVSKLAAALEKHVTAGATIPAVLAEVPTIIGTVDSPIPPDTIPEPVAVPPAS